MIKQQARTGTKQFVPIPKASANVSILWTNTQPWLIKILVVLLNVSKKIVLCGLGHSKYMNSHNLKDMTCHDYGS